MSVGPLLSFGPLVERLHRCEQPHDAQNGAVSSAVLVHHTRGTGPLRRALAGATRSGSAGVGSLRSRSVDKATRHSPGVNWTGLLNFKNEARDRRTSNQHVFESPGRVLASPFNLVRGVLRVSLPSPICADRPAYQRSEVHDEDRKLRAEPGAVKLAGKVITDAGFASQPPRFPLEPMQKFRILCAK
jgi:hypothetical protein